jgi:hypothetical protein
VVFKRVYCSHLKLEKMPIKGISSLLSGSALRYLSLLFFSFTPR